MADTESLDADIWPALRRRMDEREASVPVVDRVKCVCGRCSRTLCDLNLTGQPGWFTPRLKGQRASHASPAFGEAWGNGVHDRAAWHVRCKCGLHIRISDDRAKRYADRATQYGLKQITLEA